MCLKEIIKHKQGSSVVGQMYRIAELVKKEKKTSLKLSKAK